MRPSAFDTIFDVTTTTSPSANASPAASAASAITAGRSVPGSISGSPGTPKIRNPGTRLEGSSGLAAMMGR